MQGHPPRRHRCSTGSHRLARTSRIRAATWPECLLAQGKVPLVEPQYRACLKPDAGRSCGCATRWLRVPTRTRRRRSRDRTASAGAPGTSRRRRGARPDGTRIGRGRPVCRRSREFRQAIVCDPTQAVFWANLGMMLKVEGQFDASLDAYDAALARAPDNRQIRVNRAVARLHAGRFAEAWQDEDAILSQPGRSVLPVKRLLPPLSVQPDLTGRTVLVVHEEGLGDTLQFMRYLPLLARRGARVVAAVPTTLTAIAAQQCRASRTCRTAMPQCRSTTSIARSTACRAPSRPRSRPSRAKSRTWKPIRAGTPLGRAVADGRCIARRPVLGRPGATMAAGVRRARSPAQHRSDHPGTAAVPCQVCGSSACRRDRRRREAHDAGSRSARCDGRRARTSRTPRRSSPIWTS